MERDLHHRVKGFTSSFAVIRNANDFLDAGRKIDTLGFDSLEYFIIVGTIIDGSYDFMPQQSEESGVSAPFTNLAPDEILGSNIPLTVSDSNSVRRIGILGKKRFQRLSLLSSGVVGGVFGIGAIAVLGHAYVNPTPDVF